MRKIYFITLGVLFLLQLNGQKSFKGFFDFQFNKEGKIILEVTDAQLEQEFIYINSLSAGIGSNDIGLDRGQLGNSRIVKFIKAGNKILLIEPNYTYRALSDNELERKAMEEAFAQSVIGGFTINSTIGNIHKIDITDFIIKDSHGVARRLKMSNQGVYKLDKMRSAIWIDRTKSFPDNSEIEALLTFGGEGKGEWIRSVAPDADAVTVRVHHSFVRLPDDKFKPRKFHPYSGFGSVNFHDYATPIEEPLTKRYIRKHRLIKKNPGAAVSEAVNPIIYYIDPGCPEPIKSALMDGVAWWDQAFQSAGYAPNTFQIKELPAGADMLDVRYNVIQWIHRSTRGWSYGATVTDPRTGEIIKGHVSLGSLRVRQDFLIAQGIYSPYGILDNPDDQLKELALARLRQLGAHEVGHTLGLSHNFAASINNRASVMDYPHPVFSLTEEGVSVTDSYDDKIGNWDKKTIAYGYADFDTGANESTELKKMIAKTQAEGYLYISDRDARPIGGSHALGHLWDGGSDVVVEMNRLLELRKDALSRFGISSIKEGTPLSELEKVLVPLYLMHRYQAEAVVKRIGGMNYHYKVKGDGYPDDFTIVNAKKQGEVIDVLLFSLSPSELTIPKNVLTKLHPPAIGYSRDRETFIGRTNLAFDPIAPAESYASAILGMMLHQDRLTRIHRQNVSLGSSIELIGYLTMVGVELFDRKGKSTYENAIVELVQKAFMTYLVKVAFNKNIDTHVVAIAYGVLKDLESSYLNEMMKIKSQKYHALYLKRLIKSAETGDDDFMLPMSKPLPPGSPIGCGMFH
ncbi:MAG: zinc-dependent metalloprotease [Saprospiraceae bacterium]